MAARVNIFLSNCCRRGDSKRAVSGNVRFHPLKTTRATHNSIYSGLIDGGYPDLDIESLRGSRRPRRGLARARGALWDGSTSRVGNSFGVLADLRCRLPSDAARTTRVAVVVPRRLRTREYQGSVTEQKSNLIRNGRRRALDGRPRAANSCCVIVDVNMRQVMV